MSWIFADLAGCSCDPVRSRCIYVSPAVSGCARTYSGQRPGWTSGPPNRLSPRLRRSSRGLLAGLQALGKILDGFVLAHAQTGSVRGAARRCGPGIWRRTRQRVLPISGSPECAGLAPCSATPCAPARGASGCSRAGSLSAWTLDGPAVDLACTWRSGTELAEVKYWCHLRISAGSAMPAACSAHPYPGVTRQRRRNE